MVRRMEERDIKEVSELEQACFLSEAWSEGLLRQGLGQALDSYWVCGPDLGDGRGPLPVGYAALRILAGEGEIQRIAVHPAWRGRGYARELMDEMTAFSKASQADEMVLEVRAGNLAAINLYKSYGFLEEAVRKGYYAHPREDACLMRRKEV